MLNIFLFLSLIFLLTFLLGRLIEKIRIPWIFAALLLGAFLAFNNPFSDITSGETFDFLAQLGMYFLLFMIGLELDLNKLKESGNFIIKSTFFIILLEGLVGTLLIHFVFGYEWFVSFVVSLSFATVGEAILIPILDEFKIINTKLGQSILGIGTLDDIIELIALIMVVFLMKNSTTHFDIVSVLGALAILFALSFGLNVFKKRGQKFNHLPIDVLFLFSLFIFFLFLGIGEFAHSMPVAALLAGLAIKTFVPEERLQLIESEIKTMCYGFFAPIFFLQIGLEMDVHYLIQYPLYILLVVVVSNLAKLLGSYIMGHKHLGHKQSILLGIGLSVRFSTSIIIIKILYEGGVIQADLFSIIVASSIVFKFIIPVLFSTLIRKWKVA